MNFVLWLIGIGEALFAIYFVSRYISVVIHQRKSASLENETGVEIKRFAS